MKRISVFPIVSLITSIIAFVLYAMILDKPTSALLTTWVILSVISVCMPILSKFLRKRKDKKGKTVEIIALIIGCFDFYFVFFALTKISLYFVYVIIFSICFLYAKVFNNLEIKETVKKQRQKIFKPKIKKANKTQYCSHCDELLPHDSEFCQYCGEKLEKPSKNPKKIATRIIALALSVVVLVSGGVLAYLYYATPYFDYIQAVKTLESGTFDEAYEMFFDLKDYKDSKQKLNDCKNQKALQFIKEGKFTRFFSYYDYHKDTLDIKIPKEYREDFYNAVLKEYGNYGSLFSTKANTGAQIEFLQLLPKNYKDSQKIKKFYNIIANCDLNKHNDSEFLKEYMPDLKQLWNYKPVRDWLLSDWIIYDFMIGDWRCEDYKLTFYYNDDSVFCQWYTPININFSHDHYKIENQIFKLTRENDNSEFKLYEFSFSDKNTLTAYCYGNGQYYTFKR